MQNCLGHIPTENHEHGKKHEKQEKKGRSAEVKPFRASHRLWLNSGEGVNNGG